MMMKDTLLITASVTPTTSYQVAITDSKNRLESYLSGLKFWIHASNFKKIVFVENSDYSYDYQELVEEAKGKSISLEVLSFKASSLGESYGKGYSEGEIFEYALKKSKLLASSKSFYKVNGRHTVLNINKILKLHKNVETCFNLAAPLADMVDTRFFKVEVEFFKKSLINTYKQVRDREGIYLEHTYLEVLNHHQIPSFKTYPVVRGIAGSTGRKLDKSFLGIILRNILLKLNFYRPRK